MGAVAHTEVGRNGREPADILTVVVRRLNNAWVVDRFDVALSPILNAGPRRTGNAHRHVKDPRILGNNEKQNHEKWQPQSQKT